jgi:para-aminobenzoate synthetase
LRTLLIDNYDSFTYNLFHQLAGLLGAPPVVIRNDEWTWERIEREGFDRIVISPGPGRPERPADFGVCRDVLERSHAPVLGVCLGMQGLAAVFGGRIRHAPEPVHGRASAVFHSGEGLFKGLPQGFQAMRYHSLIVDPDLPACLEPTAWTRDGLVMGLRHRERPLAGVQFHPESIGSECGRELLANFLGAVSSRPPGLVSGPPAAPRAPRTLHVRRLEHFPDPEAFFAAHCAASPAAWWLDSSRAGAGLARYSYMGAGGAIVRDPDQLRRLLAGTAVHAPGVPFPFQGGLVGCFTYECEPLFVLAERFLVFDHETRTLSVAWLDGAADEAWARSFAAPPPPLPDPPPPAPVTGVWMRPREQYLADIRACLEHIRNGETYQTCLTNRVRFPWAGDPFAAYRLLRRANPAPYSAFLKLPGFAAACSSPERFLRIGADGWIESKPIKGTRPRGAAPEEDATLRASLAASEKDRAENLMIVDLVRNDLGRVAIPGTVHVPALLEVETYATVHQLVSTVRARLRPGLSALDAVRAAFPGGSMTGAPKLRTMRILAELEGAPRGVYSGALGFLSFSGDADLNIVIRTAVFAGGWGEAGAGGGIVSLSDPEQEWEEAVLKARAVTAPLGVIV